MIFFEKAPKASFPELAQKRKTFTGTSLYSLSYLFKFKAIIWLAGPQVKILFQSNFSDQTEHFMCRSNP
jgi:hypothetical protein